MYLTPTRRTFCPVALNNQSCPDMSLTKVWLEGPVAHNGNLSRVASLPQPPHHLVEVHDGFVLPVRLSASARRTNACHCSFIPDCHGTSESAILGTEPEPQARDAAEFLVGDGGCPAADLFGVVDGDDDVESGELEVLEVRLFAKLATDLREARPARCVGFYVQEGLRNQSVLIDLVEQFWRKLKEMRLLGGGDGDVGSLVIRHHGVDLSGAGFECCLLTLLFAGKC